MLDRFAWLVEGLVVRPEQMRRNLELSRGLFFSQRLLLALVESGLSRDEAYRLVQGHAMRAWEEELDFPELVRADARDHASASTPATLDSIFDLGHYTRHVDTVFDRLHAISTRRRNPFMPESRPRRERQGPRALRARRRAPAAHRERPHLGVRRRPADRDPGQGSRADRPLRLLVRAHEATSSRTTCSTIREDGRSMECRRLADAPDRVRRARLPLRIGLEELPGERRGVRDRAARRASASRIGFPSRSSRRRRRPPRATTSR